ncbi:MAG: hypothetical protein GXO89_14750 [Chlorobi bacterium]|nr:hypothetical protein [Chlorobiota bacterium]
MKKKQKKANYDLMGKNPDNWKGGFYFNRKDLRFTVPKINPELGWTLNFGNPFSYALILAIILLIMLSQSI